MPIKKNHDIPDPSGAAFGYVKYAVSLEICRIEDEQHARELAAMIRARLADINEDIYVCVGTYEQVRAKVVRAA